MTVETTMAAPMAGGRIAQLPLTVLTILTGGLLIAGSYLGTAALVAAVGILQTLLVVSWVLGVALPGRIGGFILGLLAAAGADVALTRWPDHGYQPVLGILGLALPFMFIHQLTRGVVRTRVVESLADITTVLLAVCAIGGLLLLRQQGNGDVTTPAVIAAVCAALVASHLTDAVLPAPRFDPTIDRGLPAVIVGVAVGAGVGLLWLRRIIDFTGGRGAFAGAAVAAVACLLSIGAAFAAGHSTRGASAAAAVPNVAPELSWAVRLRPVAAVLMTIAFSAPAGYVVITALTS